MEYYDSKIRRITIDINQAGNYIDRGDADAAKENLLNVIETLKLVIEEIDNV